MPVASGCSVLARHWHDAGGLEQRREEQAYCPSPAQLVRLPNPHDADTAAEARHAALGGLDMLLSVTGSRERAPAACGATGQAAEQAVRRMALNALWYVGKFKRAKEKMGQ